MEKDQVRELEYYKNEDEKLEGYELDCYLKVKLDLSSEKLKLSQTLRDIDKSKKLAICGYDLLDRVLKYDSPNASEKEYITMMMRSLKNEYIEGDKVNLRNEQIANLKELLNNIEDIIKEYFTERVLGNKAIINKEALIYCTITQRLGDCIGKIQ